MKKFSQRPGIRTQSPSQSTFAGPSETVITDVPAIGSHEPLGVPIISTQGPVTSEGTASPLELTEGANVASGAANQARIDSGVSNVPKATSGIEMGHTSGLKAKDALKTAWHGLRMILKQVEGLLDGAPFKTPVAAAVDSNHKSLEELMTRIKTQIQTIEIALVSSEAADSVSTKMKEDFIKILLEDFSKLYELKDNKLWRNILENEQVKEEIQRILGNIDENTRNFQQNQLKDWPHSQKAIYDAVLEDETKFCRGPCTPNTRIAILEKIYQWAQDATPKSPHVFWLTGQAGSGKSTIAYTVAQHFDNEANKMPCILQATFFCSRQFNDTKYQQFIIPTLVYQLAQNSRSFVHSLLQANKFYSVDKPSKQMKDLLADPWQKSMKSYTAGLPLYLIVIDALDEIEGKKGSVFLKELLTTINDGYLCGFKFLVTSRPDPALACLCSSFTSDAVCHLYDVAKDDVQKDIEKYLYNNLEELKDDPGLVHLAEKADGLFIYASTAVNYISYPDGSTQMEQQKKLKKLLTSHESFASLIQCSQVDEIYCQILSEAFIGFEDDDFNARLKVLHTLLCAEERISTLTAATLNDCKDMDQARSVVKKLHAVLFVKDDCVFWYHSSFPDFIFEQVRSKVTVQGKIMDIFLPLIEGYKMATPILKLDCNPGVTSVAFSPDGTQIVSGSSDGSVQLWDVLAGKQVYELQGHSRVVTSVAFSPNGTQIVSGSYDNSIQVWNASGGKQVQKLQGHTNRVTSVAFSPDGTKIVSGSFDYSVRVWDILASNQVKELQGHTNAVSSVAFSSDGTQIVSGSYDHSVRVWDVLASTQVWKLQDHTTAVASVAFSPDKTQIVSGSYDNSVQVWDVFTGKQVLKLQGHTHGVTSVAFSPDGTQIVSGSYDNSVRVWEVLAGKQIQELQGHTSAVTSVAFSHNGTQIVSGSYDNSVQVWNVLADKQLQESQGHTKGVTSVAFSPDGTQIVSGSFDNSIRVWDILASKEIQKLQGHTSAVTSVAFSCDGTQI
ncbi:hypothetical protein C0993_002900, partial [Termitomyces sp. T159_Od127]